jgi:muconolactone D-isomerase
VEFLVRIEVSLPPTLDEGERAALLRREAERGRALRESGLLRQIWRIPGLLANVAIWSAPTADALHEALTSLPVWRYAEVSVTALATHPLNAAPDAPRSGGQSGS